MKTPLYDALSPDYDRFVRWEKRLAGELPFLERQLKEVGARYVLDTACGTGQHAIALAQCGYEVVGTDVSAGMVRQARENAAAQGVAVSFFEAGFGAIAPAVEGTFDTVLCLGNSLPHVLTREHLLATFQDWFSLLRPGGLLLVQSRNLEHVVAQRDRWMPPRSSRQGEREWLFLRFYDFEADGSLVFHVVTLTREAESPWQQQETTTRLWPWKYAELVEDLDQAGFSTVKAFGDMQGTVYAPESPNLVLSAMRGE